MQEMQADELLLDTVLGPLALGDVAYKSAIILFPGELEVINRNLHRKKIPVFRPMLRFNRR